MGKKVALPDKRKSYAAPSISWFWLGLVLLLGLLLAVIVGRNATALIKNVHISLTQNTPTPTIITYSVGRSAPYAELNITIISSQYATSFQDDPIHDGPAIVRLNMHVANPTSDHVNIVYYDSARLLIPQQNPVAPSNVHLSVGPNPHSSETGWLDFPVPPYIRLDLLSLQLGSAPLKESLVIIPFTGTFDSSRYNDTTYNIGLLFIYYYYGHTLNYHLNSINERFAYQGAQCKAGQRFYVFNFTVDNPEPGDISPGFGFDYVRLVLNGANLPPVDNTLPYTFKANTTNTGGRVVFMAPAGLNPLTLGFLSQNGHGQQNATVSLA